MMIQRNLAILSLAVVAALGAAPTANAQQRDKKLQDMVDALKVLVTAQETQIGQLTNQLAVIRDNHTTQQHNYNIELGRLTTNQGSVASLVAQNQLMLSRLQNILINGKNIQVTGANVQITNSDFPTVNPNGLGNLIIGFNRWTYSGTPGRGGSHNIVMGDEHEYRGSNSFITGHANESNSDYQYVGGQSNEANSKYAVILNGSSGRVSSQYGAILTGLSGRISASRGVVGSGTQNQIVGGLMNTIVTGVQNVTNGTQTTIGTAFNANMKQTQRSATVSTKFLDTFSHNKWFTP